MQFWLVMMILLFYQLMHYILVTGFFGSEMSCEENLERLLKNDDYNKKFFIIPNKNYNP